MIEATLRLFKAVQVEDRNSCFEFESRLLQRMLKNGYLVDPAIAPTSRLLTDIERVVGLRGEQMNASFHKSWAVVRDTPEEKLVLDQMLHYITVWLKDIGVLDSDFVYVPKETLDIPGVCIDRLPIMIIKARTKEEILEKIIELGGSGVALMQETLDDLMTIIKGNKYDSSFVFYVKNRELKGLLYEFYGIVPQEPTEFLRYVVTKITGGESLLIKNAYLINKIREGDGRVVDGLIKKAPKDLASIFFRFKPIFLALKKISANKRFFNQLRKKANRMHRPLPEDYLNSVTAQIKQGKLDLAELSRKLVGTTVFRKAKLANALQYRLSSMECDAIVYRVRNGRGWVTGFEWPKGLRVITKQALNTAHEAIVADLRKNVAGKTIYIPQGINYSVPATEKQFTGNFPTGSSVTVAGNTVVGIHWTNNGRRIDLDFSLIGVEKIGWDAGYRSDDLKTLFSGDVTDAPRPNGAAELFYFDGNINDPKILLVNYYNFQEDDDVECDLLVAHEKVKSFEKNYMVNPNNILVRTKMNISKKQNVIGLAMAVGKENRVYFSNVSVGDSITAGVDEKTIRAKSYLVNYTASNLDLRELLVFADADVVCEKPEGDYYDLSPEALTKTTILNLLV